MCRKTHVPSNWSWLLGVVVWLASAGYLSLFVFRGWVPHDEGAWAHPAERVLAGELPHRDFMDCYTGGMTYLYAAAFQLFGVKLTTIRIVFFCFAVTAVPAFYALSRRAVGPWLSALTTLVCVTWSFPNNFTGIASWYLLIFSVLGTWCLLRYFDSTRTLWMLLAGVCGDLALTTKITGLFYIAAVGLTLLFRWQFRLSPEASEESRRSPLGLAMTLGVVVCFLGLMAWLLRHTWRPMEFAYYLLPASAVCGLLVWNEWRQGGSLGRRRWKRLGQEAVVFGLGALLPLACFLMPFMVGNALGDLYRGVLVLPQKRFELMSFPLPPLFTLLFALLPGIPLLLGFRGPRTPGTPPASLFPVGAIAVGLLLLLSACRVPLVYDIVWSSVRGVPPLLVLAGVWLLGHSPEALGSVTDQRRTEIFLLVTMALMLTLYQYPLAYNIYFCYASPVVCLAFVYVAASQSRPAVRGLIPLGCFYLAYAVLWLNPGFFTQHPSCVEPFSAFLDLPRGGLWVTQEDRDQYVELVNLIQRHSEHGTYIYATPDSPEVYFLAERKRLFSGSTSKILGSPKGQWTSLCRDGLDVLATESRSDCRAVPGGAVAACAPVSGAASKSVSVVTTGDLSSRSLSDPPCRTPTGEPSAERT